MENCPCCGQELRTNKPQTKKYIKRRISNLERKQEHLLLKFTKERELVEKDGYLKPNADISKAEYYFYLPISDEEKEWANAGKLGKMPDDDRIIEFVIPI